MKTSSRSSLATVLFCLCLPIFALQAARPEDTKPGFLGWIPMQCVPAGEDLVLDMHRFYNAAPGDTVSLPVSHTESYIASYSPDRFELRVSIGRNASGILEIPILVLNDSTNPAREALLAIAVQPPGAIPDSDLPSIFAESRSPRNIEFRISAPNGSIVSQASVIAELPGGSSRKLFVRPDGPLLKVPTSGLPDGSWIRAAVTDDKGRVSRVARAEVAPKDTFQWQDGIIYYAFTDRFVDGDATNDHPVNNPAVLPQANYYGGDFAGIQKKIEEGYFKKLGVNVLWLAPLNRNPDGAWKEYLPPYRSYTGYHGYWPISHSEIEPRFGGAKGLKSLVGSAEKNDIKIIADLVLKHVHVEHPLWKEHPEWFGSLMLPDGTKNLRRWDDHQFTTWFEEWLPGFDFDKPEPVAFLIANAKNWVEKFGLDGYRLDAVKHIKYSFWPKFRSAMREMQAADRMAPMFFVGETFMDRNGIMSFVGPNMLDGQFDFPLYDTIMDVFAKGKTGFGELEDSLSKSETIYGKETLMSPLIGNHDKSRFMAFADGDLPRSENDDEEEIGWATPLHVDNPAAYEKLKLAIGFLLSIDGVPMIYYGDEVGLTGAGDPDNRRMLPRDDQLDTAQKSVREYFSRISALRSSHPALRYGNRRLLVADETRYAFVRRQFDDRVLAVWNKGTAEAVFDLPAGSELSDGKYADVLTGKKILVESGRTKFSLGPMESAFFIPEIDNSAGKK